MKRNLNQMGSTVPLRVDGLNRLEFLESKPRDSTRTRLVVCIRVRLYATHPSVHSLHRESCNKGIFDNM